MQEVDIKYLVEILRNQKCSCVVYNKEIRTFHRGGVKDLFDLLESDTQFLEGAMVADKIIGRAAAAIVIEGKVAELYTEIISSGALDLLKGKDIKLSYGKQVDHIINRKGTDWCPLEKESAQIDCPANIINAIKKRRAANN